MWISINVFRIRHIGIIKKVSGKEVVLIQKGGKIKAKAISIYNPLSALRIAIS